MNTSSAIRHGLVGAAFMALLPFAALAQTPSNKPPPRLPANSSAATQIPAGVDTGSPTTSTSVPLGTPVPPDATADRVEQRTRSAAARAAARPDPLSRTGAPLSPAAPYVSDAVVRDASRPGRPPGERASAGRLSCAYDEDPAFRNSMSQCTDLSDRSARSACVDRLMEARREVNAPVALPESGFVGSSTSPRTAAGLDKSSMRRGCV